MPGPTLPSRPSRVGREPPRIDSAYRRILVSSAQGMVAYARVRLSRLLMWSAYGSVVATVGVALLGSWLEAAAFYWGSGLLVCAAMALTIASYVVWLMRGPSSGRVEVETDEVVVHRGTRVRRFARDAIRSVAIIQRPLGPTTVPTVEIDLRSGDQISLALPEGDAAAASLVASLGLSARRVRFDLAAPVRRLFHPLLGFAAYQAPSVVLSVVGSVLELYWIQTCALPLAIVLYVLARRLIRAPVVTVGDDGILVERGLKRRYVALRDILGVEQLHQSAPLVIRTRAGGDIVLAGVALDPQRGSAAGRAIFERLARTRVAHDGTHSAGGGASDRAAYFARGARSIAAWRAALASVLEASYRASGSSVEDVASVLTSPTATPEERVGAALALRVAGEPPVRIRIAAESVASDSLRDALAAAADGDDAKVDALLLRMKARQG